MTYSVTHWRRKVFNIVGGGANLGIDRLLVGPLGPQAIFKTKGGGPAWPLQPHPFVPTHMLHVPIRFEISPQRESILCTSY